MGFAAATAAFTASAASSSARRSLLSSRLLRPRPRPHHTSRPLLFPRFTRTFCSAAATADAETLVEPLRRSILLERLRSRHLKESPTPPAKPPPAKPKLASTFHQFNFRPELMSAVNEIGISVPTEIQSMAIPAVLDGQTILIGSHTGSGKTLAYMLPIVQLLRRDEETGGRMMKPRRPRAVVLCPTRELCEQVFQVAKSVGHHARFRSTMISGGGRTRPQEDSLNLPTDMVVGTPGRILQHIEEGNIVYGEIKYLVLDEADTMFDRGFGPDIRKFLAPLKNRAAKSGDQGFQTILVTATMTKGVQKMIDEEFQGIIHLRTSTLHKKVASAQHSFVKLSGSEDKLDSLLQVLKPTLAKGNRVMVFCNTLNSSRAVDHFLRENQISTVNYHGEVPAEERVENLKKFKSEEGDCPTLVCTDLAARGLDLDVDHVIMFDFPSNSIDYLHRTGRTARMGAKGSSSATSMYGGTRRKGKVTSLVAKKNLLLATRIEEAMRKNESLEALTSHNLEWDAAKARQVDQKGKEKGARTTNRKSKFSPTTPGARTTNRNSKFSPTTPRAHKVGEKTARPSTRKPFPVRTGKSSAPTKAKGTSISSPVKSAAGGVSSKGISQSEKREPDLNRGVRQYEKRRSDSIRAATKLSVVGFRGRNSGKREPLRSR